MATSIKTSPELWGESAIEFDMMAEKKWEKDNPMPNFGRRTESQRLF